MAPKKIDVSLSGPVEGIHHVLQPVAHALMQVREDIEGTCAELDEDLLWLKPNDVATIGFHLNHLAGSTDRLFTYARGEELTEEQNDALKAEKTIHALKPSRNQLLERLRKTFERAIAQLRATDPASFHEPREVGRAKLPSTVIGLLFHAAEHAQRHSGQITTTSRILNASH